MSKTYTLSLDHMKYDSKPSCIPEVDIETGKTSVQVAKLSARIAQKYGAYTFEEIVNAIGQGQSFLQSVFGTCPVSGKPRRLESLFLYCQLATVDFDKGNITPEEIITRFPRFSILYRTFSYTDKHPKYRGVILFDQKLQNRDLAKRFNLGLLDLFPEADPICKDVTRMNYGTSSPENIIYKNEDPISESVINEIANRVENVPLNSTTSNNLVNSDRYECDFIEQAKIIRNLSASANNYLFSVVNNICEELTTFDGSYSSRYQVLWYSALKLGKLSVIRANYAEKILLEAIGQNPHFTNWDKTPSKVIRSGFYYGHYHRDFSFIKEKGLTEEYHHGK